MDESLKRRYSLRHNSVDLNLNPSKRFQKSERVERIKHTLSDDQKRISSEKGLIPIKDVKGCESITESMLMVHAEDVFTISQLLCGVNAFQNGIHKFDKNLVRQPIAPKEIVSWSEELLNKKKDKFKALNDNHDSECCKKCMRPNGTCDDMKFDCECVGNDIECSHEGPCSNTAIRFGSFPLLSLCSQSFQKPDGSLIKGIGVRAMEFIPKDRVLCVYASDATEESSVQLASNYAFRGVIPFTKIACIFDPVPHGNVGMFINSPGPSKELENVKFLMMESTNDVFPAIKATKDIKENEFLFIDYGKTYFDYWGIQQLPPLIEVDPLFPITTDVNHKNIETFEQKILEGMKPLVVPSEYECGSQSENDVQSPVENKNADIVIAALDDNIEVDATHTTTLMRDSNVGVWRDELVKLQHKDYLMSICKNGIEETLLRFPFSNNSLMGSKLLGSIAEQLVTGIPQSLNELGTTYKWQNLSLLLEAEKELLSLLPTTNLDVLRCGICQKQIGTGASTKKAHLQSHFVNCPRNCPFCDYTASSNRDLPGHIRSKHKIEATEEPIPATKSVNDDTTLLCTSEVIGGKPNITMSKKTNQKGTVRIIPEEIMTNSGRKLYRGELLDLVNQNGNLTDRVIDACIDIYVKESLDGFRIKDVQAIDSVCTSYFERAMQTSNNSLNNEVFSKMEINSSVILLATRVGLDHWVLCTVEPKKRLIKYYDSLAGRPKHEAESLFRIIRRMCELHLAPGEWETELVQNLQKQTNENDCGVFVLHFADTISRGLSPENVTHVNVARLREEIYQTLTK